MGGARPEGAGRSGVIEQARSGTRAPALSAPRSRTSYQPAAWLTGGAPKAWHAIATSIAACWSRSSIARVPGTLVMSRNYRMMASAPLVIAEAALYGAET